MNRWDLEKTEKAKLELMEAMNEVNSDKFVAICLNDINEKTQKNLIELNGGDQVIEAIFRGTTHNAIRSKILKDKCTITIIASLRKFPPSDLSPEHKRIIDELTED